MMVDLLRHCLHVSTYGDQLQNISDKFDELTKHINVAYKEINFVYKD